MKIENEIISSVIAAVKELYGQDVPEKMVALQKTKSNFEGNLTLVVFPFLKMSKKETRGYCSGNWRIPEEELQQCDCRLQCG